MLDRVKAAFDSQDYREAARLLKIWQKESPKDPWVQFYIGRYYEATNKIERAETAYRQVLQTTSSPKLLARSRQGLKRLETLEKTRRQQAIDRLATDPRAAEPAVLLLEAVPGEAKKSLAVHLARLMDIDPYSARLQLPSRGWRLYRKGTAAQMQVYAAELQKANIPAFWGSVVAVEKIKVRRVSYFHQLTPTEAIAVCRDDSDRPGTLTFEWSQVRQQVVGLLPLFADVLQYDPNRRREWERFRRKTEVQDYAIVCDLHLPQRRTIVRLCDRTLEFGGENRTTLRLQWNQLLETINSYLDGAIEYDEFATFAETALDFSQLLAGVRSRLNLDRDAPSDWDRAFALYSGLAFLRNDTPYRS